MLVLYRTPLAQLPKSGPGVSKSEVPVQASVANMKTSGNLIMRGFNHTVSVDKSY